MPRVEGGEVSVPLAYGTCSFYMGKKVRTRQMRQQQQALLARTLRPGRKHACNTGRDAHAGRGRGEGGGLAP